MEFGKIGAEGERYGAAEVFGVFLEQFGADGCSGGDDGLDDVVDLFLGDECVGALGVLEEEPDAEASAEWGADAVESVEG